MAPASAFSPMGTTLSTYYPGNGASFDRVLGEGYLRKTVKGISTKLTRPSLRPLAMIRS